MTGNWVSTSVLAWPPAAKQPIVVESASGFYYVEPMPTTLQRWGNSLAVRLPRPLLDQLGVREGAQLELRVEGERLVITRARRRPSLQDLLFGYTAEDRPGEVDWGQPAGREIW